MGAVFRRVIAGLILGPALLIGSFAWSGFLALRTVFDEDRSRDVAEELLENDAVRDQLASNLGSAIEAAAPPGIELPGDDIDRAAAVVLNDPRVEALILESLGQTHRAFLGQGEAPQELDLGPVLSSAREQIAAFAPQVADQLPEQFVVELPTERIPDASPVKSFLERTVPLLAGIAVVLALLALLTTSDRPSVLRRASMWAIGTTIVYLIIGIGIPYLLRELAPNQAEVVAALLAALLRTTLVPSIVLGGTGVVLLAAALFWPSGERRTRRPPAAAPAPPSVPAAATTARRPDPQPRPPVDPRPRPAVPPAAAPTTAMPRPPIPAEPAPAAPASPTDFAPPATDPPRAGGQPPPVGPERSRPTLPTRAKPPDPVDLPAWTGEPQEPAAREPRWLPPTWVDGHGWVMDPDDSREPPSNARYVEGVGWVVPGPPPDR